MGIYLNGALQAREGGKTNGIDVMVQWYSLHLCTRQWHVEAETIINSIKTSLLVSSNKDGKILTLISS